MALTIEAASSQAEHISQHIQALVQQTSGRKNSTDKLGQAVSAIMADLIIAASKSPELYSFRPLGKASFEAQRIGYRSAKDTIDAMVAHGLIEMQPGFIDFHRREIAQATRLRATAKLLELALSFGITPANCMEHYRYAPRPKRVANPIIVRGKREYFHDDETKGPKLLIDKRDPAYIAAAEQVQALNGYMAGQTIGG